MDQEQDEGQADKWSVRVLAPVMRLLRALRRRPTHLCPHGQARCKATALCDDCARDRLEAMW